MKHLLVTNDFPPKVGGIQSYLWELWRRLPPADTAVLTTPYDGADEWDVRQSFRIERASEQVLFPTPSLARRIDRLAESTGAELVMLDPALPLGLVGRRLDRPYGVVVHGAEVTVPRRLPGVAEALRRVLTGARLVVAAGSFASAEAERAAGRRLPVVEVPPGVDVERFRPLDPAERTRARAALGLPTDGTLVVGVSRLVPRKGFDVLIRAVAPLAAAHPDLMVAIAGGGRDRSRLERLATASPVPVRFLGRVDDALLPAFYGAGDVFAMLCRERWGGLEQEGFGIVFLEAAAAGVPQVAGASGGAAEAVVDGVTGLVVARPDEPEEVTGALARVLGDRAERRRMGEAARHRAEKEFSYQTLARRLADGLAGSG